MNERDKKLVFAVTRTDGDQLLLLIGVPAGAWEHMKDGQTQNFDLSSLGLPLQAVMFGAPDHAAIMKTINAHNEAVGVDADDERDKDFSIKPRATH